MNINNQNRPTSRNSQLSAKNRLVYKKDSLKTLNTKNIKNEMTIRSIQGVDSKLENKENEFSQANVNYSPNRINSENEYQNRKIKSMSGI